jgi:hypothetical protein
VWEEEEVSRGCVIVSAGNYEGKGAPEQGMEQKLLASVGAGRSVERGVEAAIGCELAEEEDVKGWVL